MLLLSGCGNILSQGHLSAGGTGESYPGGDDLVSTLAGRYLFQGHETTCVSNGQLIPAYVQHTMEITRNSVPWHSSGACGAVRKIRRTVLNDIYMAPYNPDFFIKLNDTYVKEEMAFLDGERVEIISLCRKMSRDKSGIDIVQFRLSDSRRAFVQVYWGNYGEGQLKSGTMGPLSVDLTEDALSRNIIGDGLSLTVDKTVKYTRKYVADPERGANYLASASLSLPELTVEQDSLLCTTK